jgi:dephospho-CoA kinase
MLRVGLTGGIGSGKSTVAALFARHGAPVIDTDEIARELLRPGREAYRETIEAFGKEILDARSEIDRRRLAEPVFRGETERRRLEAILHPRIREEVRRRLAQAPAPYVIVVVPLLIEAGFTDLVDRILVVDADESTAIRRAAARTGRGEDEIRRIARAQLGRPERLSHAHDVIANDSDLAHLEREVGRLHARYLALAEQGTTGDVEKDEI